jgi:hypothetical protein
MLPSDGNCGLLRSSVDRFDQLGVVTATLFRKCCMNLCCSCDERFGVRRSELDAVIFLQFGYNAGFLFSNLLASGFVRNLSRSVDSGLFLRGKLRHELVTDEEWWRHQGVSFATVVS